MKKAALVIFIFLTQLNFTFGQVTSNEEASNKLKWLIENPQVDSVKNFEKITVEIFKWYALNYPNLEFRTSGISEFMESGDYKFYREILMVYNLSEFDNQINKNIAAPESAYLALKNVLLFYSNLTEIDPTFKHPILEEYNKLTDKQLQKRVTKS